MASTYNSNDTENIYNALSSSPTIPAPPLPANQNIPESSSSKSQRLAKQRLKAFATSTKGGTISFGINKVKIRDSRSMALLRIVGLTFVLPVCTTLLTDLLLYLLQMTKLSKSGKGTTFTRLQDDEELDREVSHWTRDSRDGTIGEKGKRENRRSEGLQERKSPMSKEREISSKKVGGVRSKEPYKMNIDSIIEEESRQKALNERTSTLPKVQQMIQIPSNVKVRPYMPGVLSAVREAEAKLDFKPSPETSGPFLSSEESGAERDRPTVDPMGFVVNQRAAVTKESLVSGGNGEMVSKLSR